VVRGMRLAFDRRSRSLTMMRTLGAAVGAMLILLFLAICAAKLTWHDPTSHDPVAEVRR
jgi:hypothetical protein